MKRDHIESALLRIVAHSENRFPFKIAENQIRIRVVSGQSYLAIGLRFSSPGN